MEQKSKRKIGNNGQVFARKKLFVMVTAALLIGTGFLIFVPGSVKADAPILASQAAGPPSVAETGLFSALSNWTHVDDPGPPAHNVQAAELYFQPQGLPACSGTPLGPMMPPVFFMGLWRAIWQNLQPIAMADYAGPGVYEVMMRAQDNGPPPNPPTWSACSPAIAITVTGPDTDPPYVAGHGETPPPGSDPMFTVSPASGITVLQYTVSDILAGNSFITDAEVFVDGPSMSEPPPDPSWVNDTGIKPDEPLPLDPWWPLPPPPPQTWDTRTRLFLNTTFDVSGWTSGTYWFFIHGADCGLDTICEGGASGSDDNWGDFLSPIQKDTRWFVVKLNVVTGGNNPPVLAWTGEPGYVSDGVNPDTGDTTTIFEYRVDYSDVDNDPPTMIEVHIDRPCLTPILGSPFIMSEVDPLDITYTDGKLYNFSTVLTPSGSYEHYFSASDGLGDATGPPTIACTAGPTVSTGGNNAPVMAWTGEPGFTTDGVNPDTGDTTTVFEFRIDYSDADDDPPVGPIDVPYLHIEMPCTVPIAGSPFAMSEVDPLDIVYTDGKLYNYSTTLASAGNYEHYFTASDGIDPATGAPTIPCTAGPTVTTAGAPSPPPNLWVERSSPNIIVHWDTVTGADSYNVYSTNDRFESFPWAVMNNVPTNSWTHAGAYGDTLTWYYVVRALNTTSGESTNSTMGVKIHKDLATPSAMPGRNIYWISLPYVSMYTKASDIVMDIEGSMGAPSMINGVCKWNPTTQNAQMFIYAGRWRGADFPINAGDGICINSINPSWTWVINGTDTSVMLGFTHNPATTNKHWISLPYTNNYKTASDIVMDIEGSLGTANKISVVGMWNATSQAVESFYWDGGGWTGVDFTVDSGEGLYLEIEMTFTWAPELITPSVP